MHYILDLSQVPLSQKHPSHILTTALDFVIMIMYDVASQTDKHIRMFYNYITLDLQSWGLMQQALFYGNTVPINSVKETFVNLLRLIIMSYLS